MIRIRECADRTTSLRPIFDRALASAVQNYVCATDEEKVIGFGSLTLKSNLWQAGLLGHIDELVVDATHRG